MTANWIFNLVGLVQRTYVCTVYDFFFMYHNLILIIFIITYVFSVLYEMPDCDFFFRVHLLCDDHFMLVEQKKSRCMQII